MVSPDLASLDIGPELVKSESDKKAYRLVHLSSGLRALLIHDPPREEYGDDELVLTEEESVQTTSRDSDNEEHESPETGQKAAVALTVGVGSFCDPPVCEGLAHYCEHGLFLGSKKFPGENDYSTYVVLHGGSDNAMTETEYTMYNFDVVPSALEGALDRFASFFGEPLLRHDSCARELQAIDEEFSLSRNDDDYRLQELHCHTSVDGHPCRKFCWGNTRSLMAVPLSKGIDVRKSLVEFHQRYYKAPLMQLCVLGTQSLDELQGMVCRCFSGLCSEPVSLSEIKNRPPGAEVCFNDCNNGQRRCQYLSFLEAGMPFPLSSPVVYRVRPVKDTNKLFLRWQLPPQCKHCRSDPCGYLSYVVGHEGKGSLYSALQAKGWATGLVAGVIEDGQQTNTAFSIFTVSFKLTEKGMGHWEDIVELLFSLLALLRKNPLPKWIQDELRRISLLSFKFQEEMEPADFVCDVVSQMLPALGLQEENLLCSRYMLDEWRPELVKDVLHALVPGSIRVELLSTLFGRTVGHEGEVKTSPMREKFVHASLADTAVTVQNGRAPLMDPNFGVEYWVDPISNKAISRWEDALFNVGDRKGLDLDTAATDLSLPEPNAFIPDDVSIKPSPPEHKSPLLMDTLETVGPLVGLSFPKTDPPAPEIVQMQHPSLSVVWHLQDWVFKQPKAEVRMKISFNEANTTAENACYRDLLALMVQDSLTEIVCPASIAELQYSLKSRPYGFYLCFGGFNNKLLLLAETVVTRLLSFEPHVKPLQFEAQRESLLRSIKNANLKSGHQVGQERKNVLADKFWPEDQKLLATSALTVDGMKLCLSRFFGDAVRIEALIHGNVTQDDARGLSTIFQGACSDHPSVLHAGLQLPPNDPRDVVIPLGARLIRVTPNINPAEPNALEMYYQIGHDNTSPQSTRCRILLDVVEALMEEPIFDELRTKQQLGYSVGCRRDEGYGTLSFTIFLQSASHDGLSLVSRVKGFIQSFACMLSTMDTETFNTQVASLARLKLQRDNELSEETFRHWKEISTRRHRFHSRFASARSLADISQDEVSRFFNQWFLDGGNSAGMLAVVAHAGGEVSSHHEMATSIATVLEAKERPQVMPLIRKLASYHITRQGKDLLKDFEMLDITCKNC